MKRTILKIADLINIYPLFNGFTKNTATVFMLHSIVPVDTGHGEITTGILERYFDYLKRYKYKVLSLSEYVKIIIEKGDTHKCVVFTVDDGYRDFYFHAYKVFNKYNYPATIFVTSDFVDKRLFMWWDSLAYSFEITKLNEIELADLGFGKMPLADLQQRSAAALAVTRYCKKLSNGERLALISKIIKILNVDISDQPKGKYEPLAWSEIEEMQKNRIEFHPHTKTHPIIASVTSDQKIVEIEEPKQKLESHLGVSADVFCYPNGQADDFDEETIEILKKSGYVAAVTGVEGFDNTKSSPDLFRLHRYAIPDKMIIFKQFISGLEAFKKRIGI
jgi:peptidoglycan/xylan/chitin deacetylase (PgdA/CDA1 family)